jgi:phosphoribosylformylglycinamidine synthase subunit PurQ / glutaminase
MAQPKALVLRAPGTNCDQETAYAFELSGGAAEVCHVNALLERPAMVSEYQILCIPGGFSYGDDIAAGKVFATQLERVLSDRIDEFKNKKKLILGICNGFQVLIKSGFLDGGMESNPLATLTWNDHGRYVDRWVQLKTDSGHCAFLTGVENLYLPIAHAEGRFVIADEAARSMLQQRHQLALRYTSNGTNAPATAATTAGEEVSVYNAANPNGSMDDVAGICDPSGQVFGLMPHPERFVKWHHHPRWTRIETDGEPDGLKLFKNAVEYFG